MQATLSDILRQLGRVLLFICSFQLWVFLVLSELIVLMWVVLGTHFGLDLMHRKAEVKDIITDVINNMTDEEDEGEEEDEDNAEDGGDADKDDGDDDA